MRRGGRRIGVQRGDGDRGGRLLLAVAGGHMGVRKDGGLARTGAGFGQMRFHQPDHLCIAGTAGGSAHHGGDEKMAIAMDRCHQIEA